MQTQGLLHGHATRGVRRALHLGFNALCVVSILKFLIILSWNLCFISEVWWSMRHVLRAWSLGSWEVPPPATFQGLDCPLLCSLVSQPCGHGDLGPAPRGSGLMLTPHGISEWGTIETIPVFSVLNWRHPGTFGGWINKDEPPSHHRFRYPFLWWGCCNSLGTSSQREGVMPGLRSSLPARARCLSPTANRRTWTANGLLWKSWAGCPRLLWRSAGTPWVPRFWREWH